MTHSRGRPAVCSKMKVKVMNEVPQLAGAMLAIAFAAVMLVAGQLYIENRSARLTAVPAAQTASVPWDPRTYHTERPPA
jgi:hypothetical protein